MNLKKSITWAVTGLFIFASALQAEEIKGDKTAGKTDARRLAKSGMADDGPTSTFFNINSWKIQMEHQGFFQWNGTSHGSAGNYPKGMGSVIFAEGILWGVKATDKYGVDATTGAILTDGSGSGLPRVRVNGSMYNTGLKAGKVLRDANGKIKTSGYSENYRDQQVWRVRKDWNTGDLTVDASILRDIAVADVTESMITADKAQYEKDWTNWPASEGAPYDDVDGDGAYTPGTWSSESNSWVGDIPGIPGADQTIWTVANDLPDEYAGDAANEVVSVSEGGWGSPPVGFEMQLTLWGYDFPFSNPISSMMFKRARMIYTGLPGGPADATLDTVYFTQWSDPDLGTYTDDYVGADTSLSLGYVYNGNTYDDQFLSSFGSPVPAAGYDFLEGPKVDVNGDGVLDTLGMTSFVYFAAGSSVSDPSTRVYDGTLQWFNLMEGYLPRPGYPTQEPFVDPITGYAEKFVLAGDPTTATGWVDGIILPPGDRRLVMNTGPFQMAINDTQDVVVGLVGGLGINNLSSVAVLKYNDKFAQFAYDNNFELPQPPPAPTVSVFEGDGYITLNWAAVSAYTQSESYSQAGFKFEGYKVYQLPNATASAADGVVVAIYDVVNGVKVISEPQLDGATGLFFDKPQHVGTDSGISRVLILTNDALKNRPITNDRDYYFGVVTYAYLEDNAGAPFKSLESSLQTITIAPKKPNPGTAYEVDTGDYFDMAHSAGVSDGQGRIEVIDPGAVTGHNYKVTFEDDGTGTLLWNVTDVTNSTKVLSGYSQGATYADPGYPAADGLSWKVTGPPDAFKKFAVVANKGPDANGNECTEASPCQGTQDWGGFGNLVPDTSPGRVNQSDGYAWFFHGGGAANNAYDTMISRIIRGSGWKYLIPNDFEYRFTYEDDNYAYAAYTTGSLLKVPFEMWDITNGFRLVSWLYDFNEDDLYGLHPTDHPGSGGANDPYTDWHYPRLPVDTSPGEAGYQAWLAASIAAGGGSPDANGTYAGGDYDGGAGSEVMGRNVWFVWNLDDVSDGTIDEVAGENNVGPEKGTVLRIYTNKTNQVADEFTITAPKQASSDPKEDVKMINVFPNPYMGRHELEGTDSVLPLPKYVTFNHLPTSQDVYFKVFNVSGTMVANFQKSTTTQYQKWNMRNSNDFPLASGVYVIHIDMPGLGTSKVLKFAMVTEEEFSKRF